ncbi:hypothetical protein [Tamlana sp. I1]|uniref:hypothetical protein n=1 Tax=Tamlana sp. I1 TaxID=2762061 RepID=UPI00188DD577|nr:hypothetical protein [Tamlana sp. I1]
MTYHSYSKETDEYIVKSDNKSNKFEPLDNKETVKQTLNRSIESGNDPTVKEYQIDKNTIIMTETNIDGKVIVRFKGEILLDGDAIRGVFYNKGEQVTPMRVYYNVDKPLPNPLLPDNDINENI